MGCLKPVKGDIAGIPFMASTSNDIWIASRKGSIVARDSKAMFMWIMLT
jgi:hypothetical protein